jgi:hypothetical protein
MMATVLHANWVEWTFAVSALASVVISFYSMHDVMKDSSYLLLAENMDPKLKILLETIATGATWQELIRLAIAGIMLVAAGSFLFLEPPPPPYHDLPQSLVGLTCNTLICIFISVKSVIDLLFRRRVRKGIRSGVGFPWTGEERRFHLSIGDQSEGSSRKSSSSSKDGLVGKEGKK